MNPENQQQNSLPNEQPSAPNTQTQPLQPAPQSIQPAAGKHSFGRKITRLLKSWKFWLGLVGVLLFASIIVWFTQPARWWAVNLFGARNTLSITAISPGEGSKSKRASLKNVTVTVNGRQYHTDNQGKLTVPGVPYGHVAIIASKAGYQSIDYGVNLDFDPFLHKFGGKAQDDAARSIELSLAGTGIPVAFKVVDALSGKPVTAGEFTIGDVVAKPDDQGQVSLRIPGTDASKVTVTTNFGGSYVDKQFDITLGAPNQQVSVVPGGRHYFVSKRDGTLTVYGINLDGSDVQPIVTGTGQETSEIAFAVSPDGKYGILSSSRDGARNSRHDVLQRVYVVNLQTKQLTRVDEGVAVAFADWSGDTLVYTTTAYDSTGNAYPTTLRSVDATTQRIYNFETAESISVSTVAFDRVAYQKIISSGPDQPTSPVLRVAQVNGTGMKTLGEQVDYGSYAQIDFDRIDFKTAQDQAWHEYNFNTDNLKTIAQPIGVDTTVQYLAALSADGGQRLMVSRIDGKYALLAKNMATGAIQKLYSAGGLAGPIRMVGNVVTYRVNDASQTTDYAIPSTGGDPHKITDATASEQPGAPSNRFGFY